MLYKRDSALTSRNIDQCSVKSGRSVKRCKWNLVVKIVQVKC